MRALIIGINGQDGSYLAEELLTAGYEVHGTVRRSSVDNLQRIHHVKDQLVLHDGELTNTASIAGVIRAILPLEIYHLADQDHVGYSYVTAGYSMDVTAGAVVRLLEAVSEIRPNAKIFVPSSATIFGDAEPPQNERTPLSPMSPYAVAKAAVLHACRYYRKVRKLNVWCGIMFNHDSPRRKPGYLLWSICDQALKVARGLKQHVELYGLGDPVDIGSAEEYVGIVRGLLQKSDPEDYVIATGVGHTVREMAIHALGCNGFNERRATSVILEKHSDRIGPSPRFIGNISKIKSLGMAPAIDSLELISQYVKEQRS